MDARRAPGARRGGLRRARRRGGARLARLHGVGLRRRGRGRSGRRSNGIDIIRGEGRIVAPGTIEVGGETHTAERHRDRHRLRPGDPADPGLRELEGVWTNREVTGLKPGSCRGRLLVLGGGPVGVEMAQALRRMGSSVALVEGAEPSWRASRSRSARRSARRWPRRASSSTSASTRRAARREGEDYVLEFPDGKVLKRRQAAGRHRAEAARGGHRPGERRDRARQARHRGRRAHVRRRGRLGDRGRDRHLAADLCRQVPGPRRGGQHPRPGRRGELRRRAARRVHGPAGRRGRRGRGRGHGHRVTRLACPARRPTTASTRTPAS